MSEVVVEQHKGKIGVNLTDAARQHIVNYLAKQVDAKGVRLSVKKTGCSGLSYVVDYVAQAEPTDFIQQLPNDYILCVDHSSMPFLNGLEVDYVKQGLNAKFSFKNPNQTGACGCGESFTVA